MNKIEVKNGFLHLHSGEGKDIFISHDCIQEIKPSEAETVVYTLDGSMERVVETTPDIIDAIGNGDDWLTITTRVN